MTRLRLAFLGDAGSPHLRRWLDAFVRRGHAVALLEPAGDIGTGTTAQPDAGKGTDAEALPAGVERLAFRGLPPGLSLPDAWATWRDLRRVLAEWRPDVVHAHYARRPAWHAWLSGHRPYVVTVWGSDVLLAGAMTRIGRAATGMALRHAALVTAGTRQLAAAAIGLGAPPERVREAQFGIDMQRFRPGSVPGALRSELGLGSERVIVSPRVLAPLYRHEVVIAALAQLPDDVVVLSSAMHADPVERARLQALAAKLGVGSRWRILPTMDADRMAMLYRLADVVVSVPESDAMPQSVMEAMATGRPAVVSDLPGPRDWLADLAPDLLVPVGDPNATAAALRAALALLPDARQALAGELRARIVERADARASMDLVDRWYHELAGASSA